MRRLTMSVLACTAPVLLLLVSTGRWLPANDKGKPANADAAAPSDATAALLAKLHKRARFAEVPRSDTTTLREVLTGLAKDHGVPIEIDESAFGMEEDRDGTHLDKAAFARSALPARETTLARRLQQVLDRARPKGAFAVRADHVEITTKAALGNVALLDDHLALLAAQPAAGLGALGGGQVGGNLGGLGVVGGGQQLGGPGGQFGFGATPMPLVNVIADRRPLEAVVKDLAAQVEYNLTIDPRLGEKARTAVTARLLNAPLDSALLVLTEMAELRPVRLDTLFFITTPEKGAKLLAEWKKSLPPGKRVLPGWSPLDDGM